ncbi:MAG: HAD-IA family hydrolase [bacterium]|nr:HAD-IA family hydrolase [bacterium]
MALHGGTAPRPGAFIFDLDGTLVDSRQDIAAAANVARAAVGLGPLGEPVLRAYVGDGVALLLRRALGHDAAAGSLAEERDPRLAPALAAYLDHYGRHLLDHTRPYAGVPEMLARLPCVPLAVATNKPGGFSRTILAGLGLAGCFRVVIGSDEVPARKPDPAHLRACLAGLDVAPAAVVVVGDSRNDILAAQALGAVAVACAWGLEPAADLRALGPDHLLESPLELAALYATGDAGAPEAST